MVGSGVSGDLPGGPCAIVCYHALWSEGKNLVANHFDGLTPGSTIGVGNSSGCHPTRVGGTDHPHNPLRSETNSPIFT